MNLPTPSQLRALFRLSIQAAFSGTAFLWCKNYRPVTVKRYPL